MYLLSFVRHLPEPSITFIQPSTFQVLMVLLVLLASMRLLATLARHCLLRLTVNHLQTSSQCQL